MYSTLNISSKEVRLLALNKKGVQYWSSKELLSGWVKDGHIMEPKGVGATIESLFKSAKIAPRDVVICVTGLPFTYRIVKLPPIKQSVVKESIKHFMSKETSMPTEQMCLSWATITESDDEVTYFVLGVDQKIVDAVAETMKEAKIKRWTMDLKSLALARAASPSNAIVVSAESDCYDIVLIDNGNISTIHTVSKEESEHENIEHARQLVAEISKAIAYDAKKHGRSLFGQDTFLLLTGEMSCDSNFRDLVQTEIEYPIKSLTPPLALPPDFPVHLYSTNIGLGLKYSDISKLARQNTEQYKDIDLDILSGRYAKSPKGLSALYWVSPIFLITIIGLVIPVHWANIERDMESLRLQNELSIVTERLQQARLSDEMARQIEIKISSANGQLENLKKGYKTLFGKQGEFTIELGKIINALPDGSFFTHIALSSEGITVKGNAGNAFKVVDYTENLEQEGLSSDIRISQIGEGSDNSSATFDVIITR